MGFLLAAAAVWLFYVLAAQVTAEYLAFIQLAILGLALAAWLFRDAEGKKIGRGLASVGMMAAAVLAVVLAVQSPAPATASAHESGYHQWVTFDETEALRLSREEGRFVFVDVTADWCVTCKTIERLVLETEEVAAAFEDYEVVAMKADWTNRDDRITDFLASYGKAAVPFYVLYRPGGEASPFGEVVTKTSLLEALETADVAALPEP
jgi:thiol:disulfide interchange protein DsbD